MADPGDLDSTSQPSAGSSSEVVEAVDIGTVGEPVRPLLQVLTGPFDPKPHTTRLRGWLALSMTGIFFLTVIGAFLLAVGHCALHLSIEQVNGFTTPIISTEVALLGTALGFYFGDRST